MPNHIAPLYAMSTLKYLAKPRSAKQKAHQKRWQALGTVMGFNGYLNNLQYVIKSADVEPWMLSMIQSDINQLKLALNVVENHLRKK